MRMDRMTAPDELSGLLRFAVAALRDLDARGRFLPSPPMQEAGREYRRRTDTVTAHATERLVFDSEARTRVSEVYEDYKSWCVRSSRRPLGSDRYRDQLVASFEQVEYAPRYSGYPTLKNVRIATEADHIIEAERLGVSST